VKKLVFVLVLLLSGCYEPIPVEKIEQYDAACQRHGGAKRLYEDHLVCQDDTLLLLPKKAK
jgi:hypothetical protein